MTDKRQARVTPQLVAAIADAYHALRAEHRDLPDALVTVENPPPATKRRVAWWAPEEIITPAGGYAGRIVFSYPREHRDAPSVLGQGGDAVFATLVHEAAHALATARGIKDSSRGGQYHNERYRDLAVELGLDAERSATGWSTTTPTPALLRRYRPQIRAISRVLPEEQSDAA
jgi:hypothetical protein